ncbi:G5 domain-containing protein [Phytoactinopolyspora halotolerans]|uniref:G5 domain-containing protein n=1 Tax=Phytoactinopolyspora halotolerans TaxID=1981512 RepID=UPI001C2068DE|nr:G5 domain-containing protein [Phytoactinopolyspora halotolerans]
MTTETETEAIPFKTVETDDPDMPKGESAVVTEGVEGEKTLTYEVTATDGEETSRELVDEEITTQPVDEVIAVGTYVEPEPEPEPEPESEPEGDCDPNYAGACVPIDSDVDCAGGSGDGPSYVRGPVTVIGTDVYRLDADGDGIACEQ